ncbi:hypothetical protein [Pseudoduganella namucuonensis]|uniref:Uncharacterized protein n=1 Tax=Pseudoduganella namucuonensis TaxID=1035707 RepID=A0A1I7GT68_9BURK|nr:hypothetical protein [Pseudoduganella namucuonensis]SFU51635.1 hypothetical protein SAMN05216552_100490 [Pseudoduganella namucuonensis]
MNTLLAWLKNLSRLCGFETADSFPPGHAHARTRWVGAYFDIASDVKPEEMERRIADAIANTPLVFAHITHPTPRMQRALLGVIEARLRHRNEREAAQLAALLIKAYQSPHTAEAVPGLRHAIDSTVGEEAPYRVRNLLAFLADMQSPFDVIEMRS